MGSLCKEKLFFINYRAAETFRRGENEIQSYDPENQDDIFAGLDQRIGELKFKFRDLESRFAKKKRQIPRSCIICFDDF